MTPLDWAVIVAYLLLALGVGLALARRASESEEEYFVGGRSFPWWLAGTSMVATTFAADTPLAVTGLIATGGIAGNWVWWAAAVAHVLTAALFARYWRRLSVITDAEVLERRYSGRAAAWVRGIKAGYEALFMNCLAMGWVILAMRKLATVLFPDFDPVAVTLGLVAMAVLYSLLGGIRSVVLTDLVQFTLAMAGAIVLAFLAVSDVGGLGGLVERIHATYPAQAEQILGFVPGEGTANLPVFLFGVLLTVGWWRYGQGNGYIVQRLSAVRTPTDAERAGMWFAFLHNAVRPWPWLLVGLVALVVWPLDGGSCATAACAEPYVCKEAVCRLPDREAAYVMLMVRTLPPGLLGLLVVGMLAAFMSTIDTHVNWGSSYVVRDFWQRFVDPNAPPRRLVLVGRLAVVVLATIACVASFAMDSIATAWLFLIMLGSGMGSVAMAKWLWWRVNAIAEISAIIVTTVLGCGLVILATKEVFGVPNPLFAFEVSQAARILIVATASVAVWVPVTLLTRPTDPARLREFAAAVRPPRLGWPDFTEASSNRELVAALARAAAAFASIFGFLFGVGGALLRDPALGYAVLAIVSAAAFAVLLKSGPEGP